MRSKRHMTMAKRAREQAVRERRVRKQEKKEARRLAAETPGTVDGDPGGAPVEDAEPPAAGGIAS